MGLYLGRDIGIKKNGEIYLFRQNELKSILFEEINKNHDSVISENLFSIPYAIHTARKLNLKYSHKKPLDYNSPLRIAMHEGIKNHKKNGIFYKRIDLEKIDDRNIIFVELNNENLNQTFDVNLKAMVALYGNNETYKEITLIQK